MGRSGTPVSAVPAELKLRHRRMLLKRHIAINRIGRFAGFGTKKVFDHFEARLASDSTNESVFDDFIELAQMLLD